MLRVATPGAEAPLAARTASAEETSGCPPRSPAPAGSCWGALGGAPLLARAKGLTPKAPVAGLTAPSRSPPGVCSVVLRPRLAS
eukprot:3368142-Alexandrium_andersonii.AAC.1